MLRKSIPAPHDIREALSNVLSQSFLFLRSAAGTQSLPETDKARLISELADALHVVPHVMEYHVEGHDSEYLISCFFRGFDRNWSRIAGVPRLEALYRSSLEQIRQRDSRPDTGDHA
ncbi:MAG: hypothetical protein V4773_27825 [Verrucomicrobiota bacterium]